MRTINLTIELRDDNEVYEFERWLLQYTDIKDFKILPDTKELYENDIYFQKLTKAYYDARRERDYYINSHNK